METVNPDKKNHYGGPVLSYGILRRFPRVKNRIITKIQYGILEHFGRRKERGWYPRLFSRTARRIIGPYIYSIKLEVNDICDQNCEMCYVPKGNTELPLEDITSLFRRIRKCGVRIELLGGEPLLRKDIATIVGLAKEQAHSPYISLYTNGVYAGTGLSAELKERGLDAAIVSLVSAREEKHDRFTTVPGSWRKTLTGIGNLRDAGIKTFTFTAIHRHNLDEIRQIYDFVKNRLRVHPLFYQYIPQRSNDPLMIDKESWYEIKNWVLSQVPEHSRFVRNFYMLTGNACSGGNFVLTVKADGSVQPCPFISNLGMGNIREKDIWDIYGHRYAFGDLHSFKKIPPGCSGCAYVSVCGGGCRAGNDKVTGSYETTDIRCLGPYSGRLGKDQVMMKTPCFF